MDISVKPFLLMAGHKYYPLSETKDWIGCYGTRSEAEAQVFHNRDLSGWGEYTINGEDYEWYCIVNLIEWMNK